MTPMSPMPSVSHTAPPSAEPAPIPMLKSPENSDIATEDASGGVMRMTSACEATLNAVAQTPQSAQAANSSTVQLANGARAIQGGLQEVYRVVRVGGYACTAPAASTRMLASPRPVPSTS